ncbi:murein L,D-transpeptidase [Rhizobiaceae bacterium BDR2-2]|uniref:Murein L,D-transpeptidase n=1 Tax=Ectorhizobium quercum TaxID=2965071 RepID=A0AAE3N640_9HYPH|nr:murein L,D-transpeptidase family protein [Ectorhizobium quercum]MCX8999212.1 murein L,D-transpeptidase [Ectorhizobium quercum]
MRLRNVVTLSLMAAVLAGCNDSLDAIDPGYVKNVRNKTEHPLPDRIVSEMKAKGMDRNAPIAIRIFKEEGVLEIWKARADNRFEKIRDYRICAWSGRLGPKVKEGDRQAPEGFYPLSRANMNPYSQYFLAINTGFPNRYDAANSRTGTNLMIHGACSSSGCYSMTDAQILEIWAFARDAFKGGQQNIQLQAFPFRMTAENMARHRHSEHFEFWKMLKAGYDHFEITKRPPEVAVCDRKYVFNKQAGGALNPTGACPAMSTPATLQAALDNYNKTYEAAYRKAVAKYDDVAWYDPTEAERKALVADQRKGKDLAFAPTGPALKAGRLVKLSEFDPTRPGGRAPRPAPAAPSGGSETATASVETPRTDAASATARQQAAVASAAASAATAPTVAATTTGSVPVPVPNPTIPALVAAADAADAPATPGVNQKTSRWKFWARQ